ncbi:MAG: hypothetical protein P9E88_13835, partial [Candidatus Competibacter sp.]|nr:hypothetical protein [Candidatus Competibacter sp.]
RPSPASHPSNLPSSFVKNKNHNHLTGSSMTRKQIHHNLLQLLTKAACFRSALIETALLINPVYPCQFQRLGWKRGVL